MGEVRNMTESKEDEINCKVAFECCNCLIRAGAKMGIAILLVCFYWWCFGDHRDIVVDCHGCYSEKDIDSQCKERWGDKYCKYGEYSNKFVRCLCYSGWAGDRCKITLKDYCSGHGEYSRKGRNCTCSLGWEGGRCENWRCNSVMSTWGSTCSGHGDCISPNECKCKEGFNGKYCEFQS